MRRAFFGLVAAGGIVLSPQAQAQASNMVSAADPKGMVEVLAEVGYDPVLGTDSGGDPKITMEFGGREGTIIFYGCAEETNDGCDSIQFNMGFDRKNAWKAADALELSSRFRFVAARLDDEGDPFISWDVVTGDGIPQRVFLQTVLSFTDVVADVEHVVFADE